MWRGACASRSPCTCVGLFGSPVGTDAGTERRSLRQGAGETWSSIAGLATAPGPKAKSMGSLRR